MKHRIIIGIVFLLLGFARNDLHAQKSKYEALYLYNFTKYMNWNSPVITIGVIGNSPVLLEIEEIAKRNPLKIKVVKIAGYEAVSSCNMIFLPEAQSRNFNLVQERIGASPIIVVAEDEKLVSQGAEVGFYLENDKLKFAINRAALTASNVQVSNSILGLAKVVD